jgi:hypothetical protein
MIKVREPKVDNRSVMNLDQATNPASLASSITRLISLQLFSFRSFSVS